MMKGFGVREPRTVNGGKVLVKNKKGAVSSKTSHVAKPLNHG